MAPVEIPDNYYLNYFNQLIKLVIARYQDILSSKDLDFINRFNNLSEPAQRLLVRLYSRKGPLFFVDALSYREVPCTTNACAELLNRGLIEENPNVCCWQLVECLPVAESRALLNANKKIRKSELLEQSYAIEEVKRCTDWGISRTMIQPTGYDTYRRLQLLYFGNEHQTLTEFILEDIGLFRYESYSIDKQNRLFKTTQDIETTIDISDLAIEFSEMNQNKDWQSITELAQKLQNIKPGELLANRCNRLVNRVAYRLEQLGQLDHALTLFSTNNQPPARERRVRILFKQKQYQAAKQLLEKINEKPLSEEERTFYRRFINKVNKSLGLAGVKFNAPAITEIRLQLKRTEQRVEQQACDHFKGSVWLENALPLSVFGLVFWQVIFCDKPGVWHHPFQSAPADLYRPEFTETRSEEIETLCNSQENWHSIIEKNWTLKQGIRNAFVQWHILSLEEVLRCYNAFHPEQWSAIFQHLLADIRNHRSGFPDLFQHNQGAGRFIEIKGPGDKLQDNQKQWLEVFNQIGIPAQVCYIEYC